MSLALSSATREYCSRWITWRKTRPHRTEDPAHGAAAVRQVPLRHHQCFTEPASKSCGQLLEKLAQLGRRFELWNRIELLERAGKRIRQAPHRSRREPRIFRLEVQAMHFGQKTSRCFQFAFDESFVNDDFCTDVCLASLPSLYLLRIGSKFRCTRSTPTASVSIRLKLSETTASDGMKMSQFGSTDRFLESRLVDTLSAPHSVDGHQRRQANLKISGKSSAGFDGPFRN
jgi:hypothetical protein